MNEFHKKLNALSRIISESITNPLKKPTIIQDDTSTISISNVSEDKPGLYPTANLSHAELSYSNCTNAVFDGSDFESAKLCHANLLNTSLRYANLKNVDFSFANIVNTDFRDSNLENANFQGAKFEGVILTGAKFDDNNKIKKKDVL